MPLYEYRCRACTHCFEVLVRGSERPTTCPACSATDLEQLISVFAVASESTRKAALESGANTTGRRKSTRRSPIAKRSSTIAIDRLQTGWKRKGSLAMGQRRLLLALALAFFASYEIARTQPTKGLDVYFVDVEGGQATLFVSPSGQSMLVDAGNPGDRDADRLVAVAKQAGLRQIDYMVTTHYDGDHHGGVKDVSTRMPIRQFVDHGPRVQDPAQTITPQFQAYVERTDKAYGEAVATGSHIVVKPGDTIPLAGIDVTVLAADRSAITKPMAGAGAANLLCGVYQPHDVDHSENSFSLGILVRYAGFR